MTVKKRKMICRTIRRGDGGLCGEGSDRLCLDYHRDDYRRVFSLSTLSCTIGSIFPDRHPDKPGDRETDKHRETKTYR